MNSDPAQKRLLMGREITDLSDSALPGGNIDQLCALLRDQWNKAVAAGFIKLHYSLDTAKDYDNEYGYAVLCLIGDRYETDDEVATRLLQEERHIEYERRQYETLKKKFEGSK